MSVIIKIKNLRYGANSRNNIRRSKYMETDE